MVPSLRTTQQLTIQWRQSKRGRQKLRWVEIKRERPRERDECETAIVVIVVINIICRYLYYLLKY